MKLTKNKIEQVIKQFGLKYEGNDQFFKVTGDTVVYYLNDDNYLCWADIYYGSEGIVGKLKGA